MSYNTVTFCSLLESNIIKYLMMGRSLELVTRTVIKFSFVSQRSLEENSKLGTNTPFITVGYRCSALSHSLDSVGISGDDEMLTCWPQLHNYFVNIRHRMLYQIIWIVIHFRHFYSLTMSLLGLSYLENILHLMPILSSCIPYAYAFMLSYLK